MTDKRVYAVIGPTAAGKSAFAMALAEKTGGEILCMDSMQIYRGMDIGTAKPTAGDRERVPHHLLDLRSPGESFSVGDWVAEAEKVIDRVRVPILVGGTGLYLQALMQGSDLGGVPGDESIREKYREYAAERGAAALHDLLREKDPEGAAKLHPNDVRRVVRALEVIELTGKPMARDFSFDFSASPYRFSILCLCPDRDVLYDRINRRVDRMLADGLLREVRRLYDAGVPEECQAIQGLGYKEIYHYFRGEISLEGAVKLIKTRTRHYAKRQITFFRRFDSALWLKSDRDFDFGLFEDPRVIRESNE